VDIGHAHHALLDGHAFEGARRRNQPNLRARLSCICHIPQPAPPLGMMPMDIHQQEMTSKPCEVYTVPQMVDSLTDKTEIQRSADGDAHVARILLLSSADPSSYASFNPNITKALSVSNSSSALHPILSYHLAHSCPPAYGYSPTNTSRVFRNPTRHLLFSEKLPHASIRSCESIIEDFLSSPSSFQTIQVSWVRLIPYAKTTYRWLMPV